MDRSKARVGALIVGLAAVGGMAIVAADPFPEPTTAVAQSEPRCAAETGHIEFGWSHPETKERTAIGAVEKFLRHWTPELATPSIIEALQVRYDIEEESDDSFGGARVEYAVGRDTLMTFDVARRDDRYLVYNYAICTHLRDPAPIAPGV